MDEAIESALADIGDARLRAALRTVFEHEGGFVDDPADPGGATNYGISLRSLRQWHAAGATDGDLDRDGDVDPEDIRRMTPATAARIYRDQWWRRHRYNRLPAGVAEKVFDLAVNMGARQAHKLLQRAVRAADGPALADDGVIGPRTLDGVGQVAADALLVALRAEAAGFYRTLVASDPSRGTFLRGWLNRAYA